MRVLAFGVSAWSPVFTWKPHYEALTLTVSSGSLSRIGYQPPRLTDGHHVCSSPWFQYMGIVKTEFAYVSSVLGAYCETLTSQERPGVYRLIVEEDTTVF